ncbi:uncharacterized protein [Amphiura filiformis]|uniref:uncharacterized protein n=1 Tax=Amphiura filiformis TaxID=82378 RepID=UPI003B2259D6
MNFLPDPYKGDCLSDCHDDTVNFEIHFEANKTEQNRNAQEDDTSTIYISPIGFFFIIALFLFFFCVCIKQYCNRHNGRGQSRIPRQISINERVEVVDIEPGTLPPHYDELELTNIPQTNRLTDGSTHVGDGGSSPPVHSPPPTYDALFESIYEQESDSRGETNDGHNIESTSNSDEHVVLSTGVRENNGDEQRPVEDEQQNDVDDINISAEEQSLSDENQTVPDRERPDHANNV